MKTLKRAGVGIAAIYLMGMTLIAFVPTASAQSNELAIEPDGQPELYGVSKGEIEAAKGRLKPEVGTAQYLFKWKVTIATAEGCTVPITVHYDAKAEPPALGYATVISDRTTQSYVYKNGQGLPVTPPGGDQITDVFQVVITVTTTRLAPAFEDGKYTVTATAYGGEASSGCTVDRSQESKSSVIIKNDYLPRMLYEPSAYVQKSGQNSKVTFALAMTNLGNGATKVDTRIEQVGKNKLDSYNPPGQQIVLSKAGQSSAKNTAETLVTVQTPHSNGYSNTFYSFRVTFAAGSDNTIATGTATDVKALDLSVQVQGVYVPGFDASMVLSALAIGMIGLGVLRRRFMA